MKYCPNCAGPKAPWYKFCSNECSREYRRKVRPSYRHYVKDSCEQCGSKDRLHVHHKNEDIRYNNPENLQTLCENCHKAHHAFEKWKEKHPKHIKVKHKKKTPKTGQGMSVKLWKLRTFGVSGILDKIAKQRKVICG